MELAIVTGASRGLGHEVAHHFLNKGVNVIGVARGNSELESQEHYQHIQADLSSTAEVCHVVQQFVEWIEKYKPSIVYMIHNAGIIEPIERVGYLDVQQITTAVNVNLVAPMIMTNELMRELCETNVKLIVVNVSSGAAERSIAGWSVYNSTKAALNMHTKVAGLEQLYDGNRHVVIAFSPGVMDTDMQQTIRSSDETAFRDVKQFQTLKDNGDLRSPKVVGATLVDLLLKGNVENGHVYSVKELL